MENRIKYEIVILFMKNIDYSCSSEFLKIKCEADRAHSCDLFHFLFINIRNTFITNTC